VSDLLQLHTLALPPLAKFALGMVLIFGIPPLARRFRLPGEVGLRIVARLGVNRLEPIVITIGATVLSDTLSLLVFAICVSTYERGFSLTALAAQLLQIVVFVPLVLIGMSRAGAYGLKSFEAEEDAYFVLMFVMMAVAGLLAQLVNLPGIVGVFLGGLALNEAVHDKPAKEKLEFFGNSFFVPIFFIVTGFLIDPAVFVQSIIDNSTLLIAIAGALVAGKYLAAQIAGRTFSYSSVARMTMWSLTLPQVAATLATALVGFRTFDRLHQRLIDQRMLNVMLALMVATAVLGPILTQHFATRMIGLPDIESRSNADR
jgi:Kef-type K+ transport system membrane component KefB